LQIILARTLLSTTIKRGEIPTGAENYIIYVEQAERQITGKGEGEVSGEEKRGTSGGAETKELPIRPGIGSKGRGEGA